MNKDSLPDEPIPLPMQRVRFVTSSEAEPGMTLAFAIQAVRSNQLFKLSAGVELTEELIDQLRRRQVNCFAIAVADTRSVEEIARQLIADQAQIQAAFAALDTGTGVAGQLYSSVMEYRLCFG